MKTAIKCIQISTINFLIKNLGKITDYREANELLDQLSGIDTFFRNQNEFLTLLGLLKPSFMVCEGSGRREYGDFQTPSILTDSICSYLNNKGIVPDIVIEPTFGKGSFLVSALEYFPKFKKIYGVEICESYYWQTKFTILELFLKNPDLHKPKIFLYLDDVFKFDFRLIERSIEKHNVLVLGNPPWVTNSELGSLNSKNLPKKSNIKSLNGLDAITGKGNFDIGEYIILMMLNSFSKYNGHMAMLAKNSVIKNLIYDLPRTNYQVDDMIALEIDTKKFFDASVKASLFECSFKHNTFSLILPENDKPVMLDDTCYFLGFDSLSEAILVWAILNSKPVKQLLAAIVFLDAKRPYTKDILMRISIDKIAKDMTYDKITDQIESLNENMLVNVTEDKWEVFLEKMNKGNSETKQLSLFEIMANPPSPFLTSTKK